MVSRNRIEDNAQPTAASRRIAASAVEDAREAGLLSGDKTEHLSLRVPPRLLEAARRRSGITSPTELGIAALALLAQIDPNRRIHASDPRRTRGHPGDRDLTDRLRDALGKLKPERRIGQAAPRTSGAFAREPYLQAFSKTASCQYFAGSQNQCRFAALSNRANCRISTP